jgi:hypothetical protein
MQKFLKGAGEVIAFLVALAGLVYLLGGLVIALRLLFGGFPFSAATTTLGQLPRQLVVTTALLEVALPAAVVGLIAVMVTGVRPLLDLIGLSRLLRKVGHLLGKIRCLRAIAGAVRRAAPHLEAPAEELALLLLAGVLVIPAVLFTKGGWGPWAIGLSGMALTYTVASLCWPILKGFDPTGSTARRALHAALVFALFAVIALVPALLLAASLKFEEARICTTTSEEHIEGRLIGEGGGQVLIEKSESGEQWVVNLPTSEVTKSEYGDISSRSACKQPSAEEKKAELEKERKADEEVGPHGGTTERQLAGRVRPYLYFDAKERWRPIAVDTFLKETFPREVHHQLCTPGATVRKPNCNPLTHLSQLRPGATGRTWIDVHGDGANGADFASPDHFCDVEGAVDCNSGRGAIYYRRTGHEGLWYWDFWWFYRYNDYNGEHNECRFYCDDHEGDWEGMVVVTSESLEPEITGAIYAAHRDRIYVPATTLPTTGTHPLAYVAEGTHATYPYVCAEGCRQYSGIFERHFPEGNHDGTVAWGDNSDATCGEDRCVRALPRSTKPGDQKLPHAAGWAAWPGLWGASCAQGECKDLKVGFNTGPQSPGLQSRFKCPWVANLKALPAADGGMPTDEQRYGGWRREQDACMNERARD